MKIAIINYGIGNPLSVQNMLRKIGAESYISESPKEILDAEKIILPGVGSFDSGISQLEKRGFVSILNELIMVQKRPILGICLGMQLMTKWSEEGESLGLGWLDAETVKFRFDQSQRLKIPHMGWNLAKAKKNTSLLDEQGSDKRFYFVHSYHVVCNNSSDILTETNYGIKFTSSFKRDNIIGVQFHPEKSHKFGYQFLKRFVEI